MEPTQLKLFDQILDNLLKTGDIESAAIISTDGLMIRSRMSNSHAEDVFAAMSATILGAAQTATAELDKGDLNRIIVETAHGTLIVTGATLTSILSVQTTQNASLGLILIEMTKAIEKLKKIVENYNK